MPRYIGSKLFVALLPFFIQVSLAFLPRGTLKSSRLPPRPLVVGKSKKEEEETTNDPLTKASWYAVETFGKVFGTNERSNTNRNGETKFDLDMPPSSLQETLQRIQVDNDREYFLTGQIDELIYDEQCVFADPFVSFEGRDRFVENLANLGSFITKYSAKPLDYQVDENTVTTRFMVKLQLNLPWKPVLAWPWGVLCEVDPGTNLIVLHKESWDIDPWEVRLCVDARDFASCQSRIF